MTQAELFSPDYPSVPLPDMNRISRVRVSGVWGEALTNSCKGWVMLVKEDVLLQGFRHRPGPFPFSGEHVGKWLLGAITTNDLLGDNELEAKIRRVVEELSECQEPDGYLGTYKKEDRWKGGIPYPTPFYFWPAAHPDPHDWDVWVHKYAMLAMLAWFDRTRWEPALVACRRAADLLIAVFGPEGKRNLNKTDEHLGLASGSILEAFVLLYRHTRDQRYLDFADRIVRHYWEMTGDDGPGLMKTLRERGNINCIGRGKAYEMMSCFVGLVEYARITQDSGIMAMLIDARDRIADTMSYPTGGMSSNEWFTFPGEFPEHANIETCVTFTWIQLNLRLYEATGDLRALDLAEWAAWNQLLPALCPDGTTWTYHLPVTGPKRFARRGGQEGAEGGPLTCCHTNGQRGLALLPRYAYAVGSDGSLSVNLYGEYTAVIDHPDLGSVRIEQHTSFPRQSDVELIAEPEVTAPWILDLRIPEWSSGISVEGHAGVKMGRRLKIHLSGAVKLHVELGAIPRLLVLGGEMRGRYAATFGPLVLALDTPPEGWHLDQVAIDLIPSQFEKTASYLCENGWPTLEVPVVRLADKNMVPGGAMCDTEMARVRLIPVIMAGLKGNPCLEKDLDFGEISVHDLDSRSKLPEYRVMLPCFPTASEER